MDARALRLFSLGAMLMTTVTRGAAAEPVGLESCNVVWDSPSRDAAGSMPLGNGDIGLNAWMDDQGNLRFYISKTDSWGDNARLLKVGKVRVSLSPNPLAANPRFRQELRLETGEMLITYAPATAPGTAAAAPAVTLRLWVDANHPVIHVGIRSVAPLAATAHVELWRIEPKTLPSVECSDIYLDRSKPGQQHTTTRVEPDTVLTDQSERIGWYHHNAKSVGFDVTREIQGLTGFAMPDPILHRTFGAVIKADHGERVDDVTLHVPAASTQRFSIYVLTSQPAAPEAWLNKMDKLIGEVENEPFAHRRAAHEAWWQAFWQRSWIHIGGNSAAGTPLIEANQLPLRLGVDQMGQNRWVGEIGRASVFTKILSDVDIGQLAAGNRTTLRGRDAVLGSWLTPNPGVASRTLPPEAFTGPLTLEAWIKPGALPGNGARIIDKITPGGSDGFLLDTWPGNSLRLITKAATVVQRNCLKPGQWQHVAATIDPVTGAHRLFLNGKPVGESRQSVEPETLAVTRAYALQRFITAAAGRGRYPIKFNGSIFTVPSPGKPGDGDYRRWGPGYWWQNTRLPYISLCTSGDVDLMEPLFRMYVDELLQQARFRTRLYLHHDGAYYPECIYFWGAVFSETYGWQPWEERQDKLQASGWHKWEWVCGPELLSMMLDYYDHTLDDAFLQRRALPFAHEILTFFDQHYATGANGKLVMHPSQAVETWWDCTNPMPELAGLHATVARLRGLPENLTTAAQRHFWQALQAKLPDLPTREQDGVTMLAPAARFAQKRNCENPELYAVFPFRLVSFEKANAQLGIQALKHRWDRGNFGWRQDDVFMAYLGLADEARRFLVGRARRHDPGSRFPAFWGPNYDWVPDQDHGGILMKATQAMLLQSDGQRIFLFPAWPRNWDVDFKLHAPYRTTIRGTLKHGRLAALEVEPKARAADIELPDWVRREQAGE